MKINENNKRKQTPMSTRNKTRKRDS